MMQLVQTLNPDMASVRGNNLAWDGHADVLMIWDQQVLLDFFLRAQLKFSALHGRINSLGNVFVPGSIFKSTLKGMIHSVSYVGLLGRNSWEEDCLPFSSHLPH